MFDIGWSELLIIGVVALIVVGPKDLPRMFKTLGQVTGKLRGMAREFTRAMEAAADETGVKDMARTFRDTASGKTLRDAAGFDEIEREFRDIGRDRPAVRPAAPPATGPTAGPKPAAPGAPAVDAETAARNAALGETEAERIRRAERAAEARRQAAEIRARREAAAQAQARAEAPPAAAPAAPPAPPAPPAGDRQD